MRRHKPQNEHPLSGRVLERCEADSFGKTRQLRYFVPAKGGVLTGNRNSRLAKTGLGKKMTTMKSGISLYDPNFLPQADADMLFAALERLPWKRHTMKMYGKEIPMPRLYQWFGVTPCIYGETITPHEWTPETLEVQERLHKATGSAL